MMQSLLFFYKTPADLTSEIESLKLKHAVQSYDYFIIMPEESLGIDIIRKVKSEILTTRTPSTRLVVFQKFEQATQEAQNALLKVLEEPPTNTILVLAATNEKNILATIKSRCVIKNLSQEETDMTKYANELKKILSLSPGERIEETITYSKSKEQAITWLTHLGNSLDILILENNEPYTAKTMSTLSKKIDLAKGFLEANVSSRAVLDVLFLGFPHIPIP
jgi:hypothetical protein